MLSPATGRCCHRRRPQCASIVASLISASGYQDPTTSPSASGAFVSCTIRVHRISPNVRDDGQRPSLGRDGRSCTSDLPDALSEIFFQTGLDSPNQLEAPRQIGFLAHAISMTSRSSSEGSRRKMITADEQIRSAHTQVRFDSRLGLAFGQS
jgi:hypothetical protein